MRENSQSIRRVFLCLIAVLFFSWIIYAQNQNEDSDNTADVLQNSKEEVAQDNNWKCEFGWNPISFNCSPAKEIDETEVLKKESKLFQEQAEIVKAIQKKEQKVRTRELALDKRQEDLRSLEQRIERKLDEIRKIQAEIEEARKKKIEEDQKDLNLLVSLYEKMDPDAAAEVINTMDLQTAVNLVLRMNPRKSAALLQATNPEVTKTITEEIARIKANRATADSL